MLFQQVITTQSFLQWLWQDRENKMLLGFSMTAIVAAFVWLKLLYPYPNFIPPDSYGYLEAASNNQFINVWPIGYSKFLQLVSLFTRSHLVLVVLQYGLLQASVLYFLFTIRYLLSPGKWLFRTLLAVSIVNPLLPHIANFVSSDCLFATLSLVWFTQLLWIIYQPSLWLLLVHAMVLLLAFIVRFNALYYPFISIAIILLKGMDKKAKLLGIGAIILPIMAFIGYTRHEYKVKTNTSQFAAFSGWLMAANSLYGYAYSEAIDPKTVPAEFRELHRLVNRHLDSLRLLAQRPDEDIGVYYFWDFKSPLVVYMKKKGGGVRKSEYFVKWASVGALYADYGRYLIQQRPVSFFKQYLWPNLFRYYGPPSQFMEYYNLGNKTVDPVAVDWFGWKNNQLPVNAKSRQIYIMSLFPHLLAIINSLFLICSILFLCWGGGKKLSRLSKWIITSVWVVWFCNMLFSVFAAPIELRYQIFPVIITLPFCLVFLSQCVLIALRSDKVKNEDIVAFSDNTNISTR